MTDRRMTAAELVEEVRREIDASESASDPHPAHAALTELAERLEAAEREPLSICAYCGVAFEWDKKGDSCPGCRRAEAAESLTADLEQILQTYRYGDWSEAAVAHDALMEARPE